MSQLIYKNGCWGCKRTHEDPQQKYVCPQARQHLIDYQKYQDKKDKKLDGWGQPIILEVGILSLLDDWETEKEAEND